MKKVLYPLLALLHITNVFAPISLVQAASFNDLLATQAPSSTPSSNVIRLQQAATSQSSSTPSNLQTNTNTTTQQNLSDYTDYNDTDYMLDTSMEDYTIQQQQQQPLEKNTVNTIQTQQPTNYNNAPQNTSVQSQKQSQNNVKGNVAAKARSIYNYNTNYNDTNYTPDTSMENYTTQQQQQPLEKNTVNTIQTQQSTNYDNAPQNTSVQSQKQSQNNVKGNVAAKARSIYNYVQSN